MRHEYTTRLVIGMGAVLLAAAVLFAVVARPGPDRADRTDEILALEADPDAGAVVFLTATQPSCGACHSLAAAGVESERASDLDVLQPRRSRVVDSIVPGTIRAHEAQNYRTELSPQQIADLAAYIAVATGAEAG
jgi:cytochrome c6